MAKVHQAFIETTFAGRNMQTSKVKGDPLKEQHNNCNFDLITGNIVVPIPDIALEK